MDPNLSAFPPAMQVIISLIGATIAVVIYMTGFLRKPNVAVSKDVIVPNINVLDGETLRDAVKTLRETNHQTEQRERMVRSMYMELQELVNLTRVTNEVLQSIEERYRQENLGARLRREASGKS